MSLTLKENQFNTFGNFLSDKTMIQFGITLIIALQLKQITTNITDSIFTPIIEKFLHIPLGKFKINVLGIDFMLGKLITNFITFIIIMFIIYMFIKITNIQLKFSDEQTNEIIQKEAIKDETKQESNQETKKYIL